jgi:hypothetical protein
MHGSPGTPDSAFQYEPAPRADWYPDILIFSQKQVLPVPGKYYCTVEPSPATIQHRCRLARKKIQATSERWH